MTLQEIKAAVDAGKVVHWSNRGYQVVNGGKAGYLIGWDIGDIGAGRRITSA